jgi:hypothetical protein
VLKKLFAKAGFICKDVTQTLPAFSDGNVSNLWRIQFTRRNAETGALNNTDFITSQNTSIHLIVGDKSTGTAPQWPNFVLSMLGYMTGSFGTSGPSDLNVLEPYKLTLFREEGNTTIFYQHEAVLELSYEEITVFAKSDLKIQNRTLSATNSTDRDDITNNPIVGYEYKFSSGCPRTKNNAAYKLASVQEPSGLITCRSAELANGYREPPPRGLFWNCEAYAKVHLEPGEIKKSTVYYKRSMNLLKLMKSCNFCFGDNLKQINLFGKASLIALEDIINVNPANNVSVAYEINREFGAFLTTKFKNCSIGNRYDMEVNNVPA